MKRKKITLQEIQTAAAVVQEQAAQAGGDASEVDPTLLQLAQLPTLIADPTLEPMAVDFLLMWYDRYVSNAVPEDVRDRVPKVKRSTVAKAVRDLRETGEASVPVAYLCKDQPEINALKPWDEVFIPPELTTENEIVYQVERIHESELRSRIIAEGYDAEFVEKAVKLKGAVTAAPMEIRATPLGVGGLTGGGATGSPVFSAQPTMNNTLIEIIHGIYRAADEDGVPTVYCTTFHKQITDCTAKHEMVEGAGSDLPYAAGVREWWCRSITSSRGVPERAHTHQNIIKGVLDSIIDRANMLALPPVNVYENPTGAQYRFGPAVQNYVRQGREPQFMQPPSGSGMNENLEVLAVVEKMKDNSYGLMSPDVPQARVQMMQAMDVQRFLMTWNKALAQMLALCREHMADDEFAEITGAPAGWLDQHREDEDTLDVALMFDVRELDPELMMKRIQTMNNLALPNDVLGTINRGEWAADMVRAIMGPLAARRLVMNQPDASAALRNKVGDDILKMFAGNEPQLIDKNDPTAASMLQMAQQIVLANPNYLKALTPEALAAVAGPQAVMIAQQLGQTNPDQRFSDLLMKYLENLKFIGVTQVNNRQVGRTGVDMNPPQA